MASPLSLARSVWWVCPSSRGSARGPRAHWPCGRASYSTIYCSAGPTRAPQALGRPGAQSALVMASGHPGPVRGHRSGPVGRDIRRCGCCPARHASAWTHWLATAVICATWNLPPPTCLITSQGTGGTRDSSPATRRPPRRCPSRRSSVSVPCCPSTLADSACWLVTT